MRSTTTELLRRTSGDLLHPSCLKRGVVENLGTRLPGLQQRSHDGWKRLRILHVSKERLGIGAYESKKTPPCVWVLPGAIRLTVWEVAEPYIWHHGSSVSCHNNTVRIMEHVRRAASSRARGRSSATCHELEERVTVTGN